LAQAAFVVNAVAKLKANQRYCYDLVDFDQVRLLQLVEQVDRSAAQYFSVTYADLARAHHVRDEAFDQAVEADLADQGEDDDWYGDDDEPGSKPAVKLSVEKRTEQSVQFASARYANSVNNLRTQLRRPGSLHGSADPLYLLKNAMITADSLHHGRATGMMSIVEEAGRQREGLYDFSKHYFVDPTFAHLDIDRARDKGLVMHFLPQPLLFSAVMSEYQRKRSQP
jgi:hypothetical protein